jgi:hypothetical protein
MALCTKEQIKARLFPNGETDTSDDALIDEYIGQVSAWVESFTGRRLTPDNAATYTFDTLSGYVLRIPRGIRSITSMSVNNSANQPDTGGSYTVVPAADRLLRPLTVDLPEGWPPTQVWLSRGTLAGTIGSFGTIANGATITGNFGFAAVPKDVEAVAIEATVVAFQARRNGASSTMGAEDIAMPPWARYFGQGSPQRATLLRYRYPSL